ncbi:MAG: TraB/GumN family protein [Bacteroidota bacterium]
MKRLITSIFLFCLIFSSLSAQEMVMEKATQKTAANQPIANSLLWAISGNGLTDTSYLYGTIHLIGKSDYFLTDQTKAAFDKSEQITFEINMANMNDMGTQMGLMMKAFMNDGSTLSDLLDSTAYAEVKAHFGKMGMNDMMWGMMERIKPMFLSVFGSMDMDMSGGGLNMGEMMSYEMEFMNMAEQQEKATDGLETAAYQMSMFDSIPYQAQAEMLYESIKMESTEGSDQMDEMVKLYKKQDLQGMMKMFAADKQGIGQYEDLLLVGRNKNWIPVMQKMIKSQPTFFAVGAGHLGGPSGVVNLLKAEGFTLTPLNQRTL